MVRSGGIAASSLPQVLDPIPAPLADKGLSRRAGDNVPIDVFAAFGVDTDGDGDVDEFIFTNNVPAGAENVSISGGASASVVLVDGHVATTIQVTSLGLAGTLAGIDRCRWTVGSNAKRLHERQNLYLVSLKQDHP